MPSLNTKCSLFFNVSSSNYTLLLFGLLVQDVFHSYVASHHVAVSVHSKLESVHFISHDVLSFHATKSIWYSAVH